MLRAPVHGLANHCELKSHMDVSCTTHTSSECLASFPGLHNQLLSLAWRPGNEASEHSLGMRLFHIQTASEHSLGMRLFQHDL